MMRMWFTEYDILKEQCDICKICGAAEADCAACEKGKIIKEYEKAEADDCDLGTLKFYYTFGTDKQFPYNRGWVEVIAENAKEADAKFREKFPDKTPGILNCAFVYTEESFSKTTMAQGGNLHEFCHEVII